MAKHFLLLGISIYASGCAAGSPNPETIPPPVPPASPPAEVAEPVAEQAADAPSEEQLEKQQKLIAALPDSCDEGVNCLPPEDFARAACQGKFPGMAIAMFEKGTPWQRLYVKVERTDAINTHGGPTGDPLVFTEEVLLLRDSTSGPDDIQVSGASDVDVLRWDGTCVTVRREFLAEHRMPTIKNATITWRYLDDATQQGLLEAKYVKIRYAQQREACRSSSATNPSQVCRRATEKLNDAITVAVRGGIELPEPEWLPEWKQASR